MLYWDVFFVCCFDKISLVRFERLQMSNAATHSTHSTHSTSWHHPLQGASDALATLVVQTARPEPRSLLSLRAAVTYYAQLLRPSLSPTFKKKSAKRCQTYMYLSYLDWGVFSLFFFFDVWLLNRSNRSTDTFCFFFDSLCRARLCPSAPYYSNPLCKSPKKIACRWGFSYQQQPMVDRLIIIVGIPSLLYKSYTILYL